MLTIEVKLNGRLIGEASAHNISNCADISDYIVTANSRPSPVTGLPAQEHDFDVREHRRNQTAWALVAKIAERIANKEMKATRTLLENFA